MNKAKTILHNFRQSLSITIVLMLLYGLIFPMLLTFLSSILFSHQANGSIVEINGTAVGSTYAGQEFIKPYFMKCRPSAVHDNTYIENESGEKTYLDGSEFTGLTSGSENLSPSNPKLIERIENDIEEFIASNPTVKREDILVDIVTASGSGLDPHISVQAAKLQITAISEASGLTEEQLTKL